ncbi:MULTISPECIES: sensor histidine kinase [unclassified Novosphingobium]|uniref:sensor histidine kinase n=1 Tax=unclassified Novosphingobium TaxID=2644732 RepID=UPI001357D193|nr:MULTISPECIES: sensor histidine kinase [unclassified Novosphingobium]
MMDKITGISSRHGAASRQTIDDGLLLRETNHRCKNDLQLVMGMLTLQLRRAKSAETKDALRDALTRVEILTRSRTLFDHPDQMSLDVALRQVCEGLQAHAEVRSIIVMLKIAATRHRLDSKTVTAVALIVNELATNAIKHAFANEQGGKITVSVRDFNDAHIVVTIDDDGIPFELPVVLRRSSPGLGLDLVMRMAASFGGMVIPPSNGTKTFEIRVPVTRS